MLIGLSDTGAYKVHCRLARQRIEARFSEVLCHGFALANRITPYLGHLCDVNWARGVVCDNPISTVQSTPYRLLSTNRTTRSS